jgi:hypothetical protein
MRFIKLAIISFIFFFLLITIVSLFIPSRVRISKATDINAPAHEVMKQVADSTNWKAWYPGADSMDLSETLTIIEKTDSVVFAAISGKKKITMNWTASSREGSGLTTIQWYMDIHLKWYPWEKFSSLFFEKAYGARMEEGLTNLKNVVEAARH